MGCEFKREKGDHRIYWKAGLKRPVVIPRDVALPTFKSLYMIKGDTFDVAKELKEALVETSKK